MKRRTWIGLGLIVLVCGAGATIVVSQYHRSTPSTQNDSIMLKEFYDVKQGVTLSYPVDAKQIKLTTDDLNNKILFRASSAEGQLPYSITLLYEDGLRIASQLTKTTTMDLVLANADKVFTKESPGYKKLSERKFDQNGKAVAEINYTYNPSDGLLAHRRIYIFQRDENTVYYLSLQAKDSDFQQLNSTFNAVAASLRF